MTDLHSEWCSSSPDQKGIFFEYVIEKIIIDRCKIGETAIDIGANYGAHTKTMLDCGSRVIAFEPNPKVAPSLSRFYGKNFSLHKVALSDRSGLATFYLPPDDMAGYGSLLPNRRQILGSSGEVSVPIYRLDDIDEVSRAQKISLIKCDVEGEERRVLNGAINTIKKHRPIILIEIDWLQSFQDAVGAENGFFHPLKKLSYTALDFFGEELTIFNADCWNVLLAPNEEDIGSLSKLVENSAAEFLNSNKDWNPYNKLY